MKFQVFQSILLSARQTFKFKGTASRADFICGFLLYIVLYALYSRIQEAMMGTNLSQEMQHGGSFHSANSVLLFLMLLNIFMIFVSICLLSLSNRRLRDAGFPGQWAVWAFFLNMASSAIFFIGILQDGLQAGIGFVLIFFAGFIPPLIVLILCLFWKTKSLPALENKETEA